MEGRGEQEGYVPLLTGSAVGVDENAGRGFWGVTAADGVVADAGRDEGVELEDTRELGPGGGREERQVVDGDPTRQ
jgi:hypothetical protein